jgi:hypothetical protein
VRRRYIIALLVVGVALFLAVSVLLARVFSADGDERSAITTLVKAQASGDQNGMLSLIEGCRTSQSCRARVQQNIAALQHRGTVSILQINPSTGFSLTSTLGTARVAWTVDASRPIVQCVRVRRAGNVFGGLRIELLTISARLKDSGADCPSKF